MQQCHQEFLAVVEEGVERIPEDRPESPPCEQLLDEVRRKHKEEIHFGCRGMSAVHVFQTEATVLEHVEPLVFTTPPQSGGSSYTPHVG